MFDKLRDFFDSTLFTGIVQVVAISSLIIGGIAIKNASETEDKRARLALCVYQYTEASQARTEIITNLNLKLAEARALVDDAEVSVFTDPSFNKALSKRTLQEKVRLEIAFSDYQNALNARSTATLEYKAALTENPVPPPPSARCAIDEEYVESLERGLK